MSHPSSRLGGCLLWVALGSAACASPRHATARPEPASGPDVPAPEAPSPATCSEPELRVALSAPTQAALDELTNTPCATTVWLQPLLQQGRQCAGVTQFTALQALPRLTALEAVPTECVDTMLATAKLETLTSLSVLCGDDTVLSVSALNGLAHLRTLTLSLGCRSDPAGVRALASLPALEAFHDLTSEWTGVSALRQLRTASLRASDLREIAQMTWLETLTLEAPTVQELGPLATLSSLKKLELRAPIHDLAALATLTVLEELSIPTLSGPTSLAPLSGLSHLRALTLNGDAVRDLSPLRALPALEVLRFTNGCGPARFSVRPLTQLPRLKELVLPANFPLSSAERARLERSFPDLELDFEALPRHGRCH